MKLKNVKLILLDVDGVLIDSKLNMSKSWNKLINENMFHVHFQNILKE